MYVPCSYGTCVICLVKPLTFCVLYSCMGLYPLARPLPLALKACFLIIYKRPLPSLSLDAASRSSVLGSVVLSFVQLFRCLARSLLLLLSLIVNQHQVERFVQVQGRTKIFLHFCVLYVREVFVFVRFFF